MTKLLIAAALFVAFTTPSIAGEWGPNPPVGYFKVR